MRKIFYLMLLLLLISTVSMNSQVTIGKDQSPISASLLELISDDPTYPRGLRLPLLTNEEVEIMKGHLLSLPAEQAAQAKGMVVFNTTTNCQNMWNGTEFKSLCGDAGPAEIQPDCSGVVIYPNTGAPDYTPKDYQQGKVLDGNTFYMTLPVTVTNPGTYNIVARTGNGYVFEMQGQMLNVGDHQLHLPASGTPIYGNDSPQYYDHITSLVINGSLSTTVCGPNDMTAIPVAPAVSKASFTFNCAQTVVSGSYIVNQEVQSSDYITVQVNVTSAGYYSFEAVASGVTFSRSGTWPAGTSGPQSVRLYATGKPASAGEVPVKITGTTQGGDITCDKTMTVAYRPMIILTYGSNDYCASGTSHSGYKILKSDVNFGLTGKIPVQSINITHGHTSTNGDIAKQIQQYNPDIIIIGYNYKCNSSDNNALNEFVNTKKGFLLMMCEDSSSSQATLRAIGLSNVTVGRPPATLRTRKFLNLDNPLLNGPFLDLRENKYWGESVDGMDAITGTLPSGYQALSAEDNTLIWKENGNIVWAGDGGFILGSESNTSNTSHPCSINTDGSPKVKTQYPNGGAYNSYFFANVMSYAFKWVQENK